MTLTTQSVLLSRDRFTLASAKRWVKKHDFKVMFYRKEADVTENYFRFRQMAPTRFKKNNYVTKEISDGVKLVLGELK